ncbi:MAG: CYTH domain-containing protein [Candidatus Woesearchaeota archaeon]
MIEIEKKFVYDEYKIKNLVKDAVFLKDVRILNVYFDDEDNSLFKSDIWLRTRDGNYELKLPLGDNTGEVKSYKELDDLDKIKDALPKSLDSYKPFLKIETFRTKYKLGEVNIDLDKAIVNGETYFVGEIEIMSSSNDKKSHKVLDDLMKEYNLEPLKLGKLTLYLKDYNNELFNELIESGVISKEFLRS